MKKYNLIILILAFFSITTYAQNDKPLIVVNGIAIDRTANFIDSIPVDQMESLKVYGATEAIEKYGEFLGSTGIIEIKTNLINATIMNKNKIEKIIFLTIFDFGCRL